MESIEIKNLSFTYPNREKKALSQINLSVSKGEFITVCGRSGCGKTTLLRLMKTALSPFGALEGEILFEGTALALVDSRTQSAEIGFVMQNPENQTVTDKVWHELAFGLESLGFESGEIRTRVAEMASFFGIQTWFHKNVNELSGGQKQLLNLASVMAMQPSVLILDEPTSRLDPIAAREFLGVLERINRELGTTVILSEHRLEDAFCISDRVIVLDDGKITADASPKAVGGILRQARHPMYRALPTPMRIYGALSDGNDFPLSVREARAWLCEYAKTHKANKEAIPRSGERQNSDEPEIELCEVYFRYGREMPDVIKGMNLKVNKGEFMALLGGNGTGKTTALSLISGLRKPYSGKVLIGKRPISEISGLYGGILGVVPQDPQSLFMKKTLELDLEYMLSGTKLTQQEIESRVLATARLCRIETLLSSHPYDLSGGEQQRAAIAKILLTEPEILLLDEPTKGMDAEFKEIFAGILAELKKRRVTVVMVSHDIEFCAEYADRCALVFDGGITDVAEPRTFFCGKSFYTTSANRIARTVLESAVLADDVTAAFGGKKQKYTHGGNNDFFRDFYKKDKECENGGNDSEKRRAAKKGAKLSPTRIAAGTAFAVIFAFICILQYLKIADISASVLQFMSVAAAAASLACFFPGNKTQSVLYKAQKSKGKISKRTLLCALFAVIAVPLTVLSGLYLFDDRNYYVVSLLIILEVMLPFFLSFEKRKPRARELMIVSVLCAIAVAGRSAFFMLPQFKPVLAIVIISGLSLGGETGFLVGAMTAFVSNFFFGQGPWTPWQMFAQGIIGFISGILPVKGVLASSRNGISLYGALCALVIFGGIMNPASVLMTYPNPEPEMILSAFAAAVPMDILHALSTALFLRFLAQPMLEKLERVKVKYGLGCGAQELS